MMDKNCFSHTDRTVNSWSRNKRYLLLVNSTDEL